MCVSSRNLLRAFLLLVFSISGCSDQPDAISRNGAKSSLSTSLTVGLTPESPRKGDCVQAVAVGGSGRIAYRWRKNGEHLEGEEGSLLCDETLSKGDVVSVVVSGDKEEARASTTVVNTPPEVIGISFGPEKVISGIDITVIPEARDADGDLVSFRYQWLINGDESPGDTDALLPGDMFHGGDRISVHITPFDDEDEGPVFTSGVMGIPDAPPRFVSTLPSGFSGREYVYAAEAVDPDGDSVSYSLETAPEGMTIGPDSGLVTWPITPEHGGRNRVVIVARDEAGSEGYQEFDLVLGAPGS